MLAVMTAVIASLVVSRYIFSYSFPWAEELTRFLLVWMVMLTVPALEWRSDHIRVDLIDEHLPARLRALLNLIKRLLIIFFLAIVVRYGVSAAIGMQITTAPATGVPMTIPYAAIPLSGALMLFYSLLLLIDDVRLLFGYREPIGAPSPSMRPPFSSPDGETG